MIDIRIIRVNIYQHIHKIIITHFSRSITFYFLSFSIPQQTLIVPFTQPLTTKQQITISSETNNQQPSNNLVIPHSPKYSQKLLKNIFTDLNVYKSLS